MKLNISKKILVRALSIINPITDTTSDRTILSNFILEAFSGSTKGSSDDQNKSKQDESKSEDSSKEIAGQSRVVIAATNDELTVRFTIDVPVKQDGKVCINAKRVFDVCSRFTGEDVKIDLDDNKNVSFSSDKARLRVASVDVGIYPTMENGDLPTEFTIRAHDLLRCIERTIFAVKPDEPRKNLVGVCFNLSDKESKWTATDGHRLSVVRAPVSNVSGTERPEIIIPRQAVVEIQKVLEDNDEDVKISFDERCFRVTYRSVIIDARLVEGKFPDIESVIPKENDKEAKINVALLDNALSYAAAVSNETVRVAKLSFGNKVLKVESEELDNRHVSDEMAVEFDGEPFEIGFNTHYLRDVLKVLPSEQVEITFKGPLSPCLIKGTNNDKFLSVIMPLRLEW